MASYPGAVPSLARPTDSTLMNADGYTGPQVIDALSDEVEAIATELGTDPAGAQATVKARLDVVGGATFAQGAVWPSGAYVLSYQGSSTSTNTGGGLAVDRVLYVPWWCPHSVTLDRIAVEVAAGVSSKFATLGIYAADGAVASAPGTRIALFGEIACSTTGVKELTVSQSVSGSTLYWLALHNQEATVTYKSAPTAANRGLYVAATSGVTSVVACYESVTYSSTAMPSSASSTPTYASTTPPVFWLRRT